MSENKDNKDLEILIARYRLMKGISRDEGRIKVLMKVRKRKRFRLFIQASAVAAAAVLFAGVYFYVGESQIPAKVEYADIQDGNRFESGGVTRIFTDSVVVASHIEELAEVNNEEQQHTEVKWKTIRCGLAKKLQVILPDSSVVHLGSGSSVSYSSDYLLKSRRVELEGLGYFIVRSSPSNPFVVAYGKNEVMATGTQFNVNSYDLNKWKVALVKGTVDVLHETKKYRLRPGRMASLNHENEIDEQYFDPSSELAWVDNLFVFNAQEMQIVTDQLSKWYGVEFEFENQLAKGIRIEGRLSRNVSLPKVLEYLSYCADIRFKEQGTKIVIY